MFFDSHAHVHFQSYKDDMDEVIQRSLDQGIQLVTVGTQKDTSKAGLDVAERFEGVWAAVGLHPNHTVAQTFFDDDELPPEQQANGKIKTRAEAFDYAYYAALTKHPKCVAIGECGLDYYRIPEEADRAEVIENQKQVVRDHFALATESNLPVIIHCRDAHDDQATLIEEALSQGGLPRRGVIHCFTGTKEEADRYIDLGFYISFSGILTFPPRKKEGRQRSALQEVAAGLPMNRLLIETDAPYLTPVPYRGKRNEPTHVQYVAQMLAELHGVDVETVAKETMNNAKNLFDLN